MGTIAKYQTANTRYSGFVSPPYTVILNDDTGAPLNLTGVPAINIELYLVNGSGPDAFRGSGTFTITDAVNGKVSYQWNIADLLVTGTFFAWITVQIPGEPSRRAFDPDIILIHQFAGGLLVAEQDVNLNQVNGTIISSSNPVPISGAVTVSGNVAGTIADGANVAQGTTADTAYSGSGAASVVAILKGMYAQQKTAAQRSLIAAYASNPAQTAASAADTQCKFGAAGTTPVQAILLQNNTGATLNYALDVTSGATTFTLQDKASVYIDVGASISVLHLSSAAQQYINSATVAGIVFQAWG